MDHIFKKIKAHCPKCCLFYLLAKDASRVYNSGVPACIWPQTTKTMSILDWLREETRKPTGRMPLPECAHACQWAKNTVVKKYTSLLHTLLSKSHTNCNSQCPHSLLLSMLHIRSNKSKSLVFQKPTVCFLKETGTVFSIQKRNIYTFLAITIFRLTILHMDCHQQES